jgi:hypothetical protein
VLSIGREILQLLTCAKLARRMVVPLQQYATSFDYRRANLPLKITSAPPMIWFTETQVTTDFIRFGEWKTTSNPSPPAVQACWSMERQVPTSLVLRSNFPDVANVYFPDGGRFFEAGRNVISKVFPAIDFDRLGFASADDKSATHASQKASSIDFVGAV